MLGDRYDADSIVKEILQNADDAGATELHFAIVPLLNGTRHPMLSSAALVVLNNGIFLKKHEDALSEIGIGSKAAEEATVGKFGLGMKSIFHWCEAFVYSFSENQPARDGGVPGDIITPWGDSGNHDDWDLNDDERRGFNRFVSQWGHGCGRWFCLWLPFRTPEQIGERDPILRVFRDTIDANPSKCAEDVAAVLPLLRSVERVVFWRESDGYLSPESVVRLAAASSRRKFPNLRSGEENIFSGRVTIERGDTHVGYNYCGREFLSDDPRFREMQNLESWPRSIYVQDDGTTREVRDKASPHGAVVFCVREDARDAHARLQISNCVFLPLSRDSEGFGRGGDSSAVRLLLHGYYFLDSGRKRLKADNDWNNLVSKCVVAPLLLPTLSDFVDTQGLPFQWSVGLVSDIRGSEFYHLYTDSVCAERQWLPLIKGDQCRWSLAPATDEFSALPGGEQQITAAHGLFPALRSITGDHAVIMHDLPKLTRSTAQPWGDRSADLLRDTLPDALGDEAILKYLLSFLESENPPPENRFWSRLVNVVQAARVSGYVSPEALQSLVQYLPCEYKVFATDLDRIAKADLDSLHAHMSALGVCFLLLPATDESLGRPICLDEATKLLGFLAKDQITPSRSNLALIIVRATDGERAEKLEALGEYRIFRAQLAGADTEKVFSWRELEELRERSRLFGGSIHRELLTALGNATSGWECYRLVEDPRSQLASGALFAGCSLPEMNSAYCLSVLTSLPALNPPDQRRYLLSLLLKDMPADSADAARGIRYLLHGERALLDDLETDLIIGGSEDDVWETVIRHIYCARGLASCIIPMHLAGVISAEHCRSLGIETVHSSDVLAELKRDPGILIGSALSNAHRIDLLDEVRDDDLWKRLPIHRTNKGDEATIADDRSFLPGDFSVPAKFSNRVEIVRPLTGLEDRYQLLVAVWSPDTLIRVALGTESPEVFASEITESLPAAYNGGRTVPQDVEERLATVHWLPAAGGGALRPCEVLHIPQLRATLERLASDPRLDGAIVHEGMAAAAIMALPGSDELREHLFCSGTEAVRLLSGALEKCADYRIGPLDGVFADCLSSFAGVFRESNDRLLVGHRVLAECIDALGVEESRFLASSLLDLPTKETVLRALMEMQAKRTPDEAWLKLFNEMLTLLTWYDDLSPDEISQLQLRSRSGDWRLPEELTVENGAHDRCRLDREHEGILGTFLYAWRTGADTSRLLSCGGVYGSEASPVAASEYFREWGTVIGYELPGFMLSLLGDGASTVQQATEWLHPKYQVHDLRQMLGWNGQWERLRGNIAQVDELAIQYLCTSSKPVSTALAEYVRRSIPSRGDLRTLLKRLAEDVPMARASSMAELDSLDVDAEMRKTSASLRSVKLDVPIKVTNLFGDVIDVEQSAEIDNLLAGDPIVVRDRDEVLVELRLREVDPISCGPERLRSLLYGTLTIALREVFRVYPSDLGALWTRLTNTERADLARTQRRILRHAFFYFSQLNDGDLSDLRTMAREWDELDYRRDEALDAGKNRPAAVMEDIAKKQSELHARLKRSFVSDADFCRQTLTAVRRRVLDYQYQCDSIPFELFQNADDAVVELRATGGVQDDALARCIEYVWTDKGLKVCHWGRPINFFRLPGMSSEDAVKHGFDRDLEKMLVLSFSSKSESAQTTGKFGLGFKSVFLYSDSPRVLSGELGFEVVGGMFPKPLDEETRTELEEFLYSRVPDTRQEGTVISLIDSGRCATSEVMQRFCDLVHVQMVFSRAVRHCRLRDCSGHEHVVGWSEEEFLDTGIRRGRLRPFGGGSITGLVLRGEDNASILLALGYSGFERLPGKVPTFWVTAPTSEALETGIAVNGTFDLDVGRARVSCDSPASIGVAAELSSVFTRHLSRLHEACAADWEACRAGLGLDLAVDMYAFWSSLWELCSGRESSGDQPGSTRELLGRILWPMDGGMHGLVSRHAVLPSGLPEPLRCLLSMPQLKCVVDGILQEGEVLATAYELGMLARCGIQPGNTVAHALYSRLRSLTKAEICASHVGILDVAKEVMGSTTDAVSSRANLLGRLVNEDLFDLDRHAERHSHSKELAELREFLRGFEFETDDGRFRPSAEVLAFTDDPEDEETMRSAFAPDSNRLAKSYDEHGAAFFRICRGRMVAPAERLAEWGLGADSDDRRKAFISYMQKGELALKVRALCAAKRYGSWLEDPDQHYFEDLAENQAKAIIVELDIPLVPELNDGGDAIPGHAGPLHLLENIHSAWVLDPERILREYDETTYPDADGLFAHIMPEYRGASVERESWLELLLRASLESMGRSTPGQHRAFLELCRGQGWIQELAATDDVPESLVRMIRKYIDREAQHVQYFQWIKQFVPIFLVSRWLEDYARSILYADHFPMPTMTKVFCPRANALLGPGDPDAPPLQDVLGIGAHFVLRELVRKRVLKNPELFPLCYVANLRVRQVMERSGLVMSYGAKHEEQSKLVYEEMKAQFGDGTFGLGFDVPIQVMTRTPRLLEEWGIACEVPWDEEDVL